MAGRGAANRRAATSEQDARLDALEQQQGSPPQQGYAPPPAAPPPAAPPAAESSMTDQLNQLAALHQQGVLSDEEFTAAKAKLLGT
jgi:Short C-terminal domain